MGYKCRKCGFIHRTWTDKMIDGVIEDFKTHPIKSTIFYGFCLTFGIILEKIIKWLI